MAKSRPSRKGKTAAPPRSRASKTPARPRAAAPKPPPPKAELPPSPLGRAELREFKASLSQARRRITGDVSKLEDVGFKKQQDGGDLSSMPFHMADQGTDSFEQDITLGLMETETDELQEIDEALQRIRDGVYGSCELCRKPIPKLRLKAIPHTRFCVSCKAKEEGV